MRWEGFRAVLAARATYLLEPKNWIIVTVLGVGWRYGGASGLAWGTVAALFAAVLPTVFITRGIQRGQWADRNVAPGPSADGPRVHPGVGDPWPDRALGLWRAAR